MQLYLRDQWLLYVPNCSKGKRGDGRPSSCNQTHSANMCTHTHKQRDLEQDNIWATLSQFCQHHQVMSAGSVQYNSKPEIVTRTRRQRSIDAAAVTRCIIIDIMDERVLCTEFVGPLFRALVHCVVAALLKSPMLGSWAVKGLLMRVPKCSCWNDCDCSQNLRNCRLLQTNNNTTKAATDDFQSL